MVGARLRLPFLAVVCGCLFGGVCVARAEPTGDLGGADRLVVRGLDAAPAASLQQGLLDEAEFLLQEALQLAGEQERDFVQQMMMRTRSS